MNTPFQMSDYSPQPFNDFWGNINDFIGIDADTFKTGNEDIDKAADKIAQQAKEDAIRRANEEAQKQLEKIMGGGKVDASGTTSPATTGTATSGTSTTDKAMKMATSPLVLGLATGLLAKYALRQKTTIALASGGAVAVGKHLLDKKQQQPS
jgi:hypothetical protein